MKREIKGIFSLVAIIGIIAFYASFWWMLFECSDEFGAKQLLVSSMLIFLPATYFALWDEL